MGRGKIEIKRIENSSNRQVTYSKRRNGIIKKAKEISVLCDAQVSLVIFASSGKMHEYCSPSTTVVDILDKYHKQSGKRLWDAKHENLSNELDSIKKENDNMQVELRHLKGEDITSLPYRDLMRLEEALETGLANVRNKQMEIYDRHVKNGTMLQEVNDQLNSMWREMDAAASGYHHNERDYSHNPHLPFAFRVQPMQPNLHDRM